MKGSGGCGYDGLTLQVEGSVQDHRYAGGLPQALDQTVITGAMLTKDGLQAARAINVGYGRKSTLLGLLYRHNIKHVSRGVVANGVRQIEVGLRTFGEHRRGKGTVGLAELDFGIYDVFHVWITWVSQDAAIAKRARPPFESALEPSDNFSAREPFNGGIQELIIVFNKLMGNIVGSEKSANFAGIVALPPIRVIHAEGAWLAKERIVGPQRGAQLTTAIPSGRLDEKLLERRFAKYATIGVAIQSHATGASETLHARLPGNITSHSMIQLFRHALDAGGDVCVVLMALAQFIIVRRLFAEVGRVNRGFSEKIHLRRAGFSEQIDEAAIEGLFGGMMKPEIPHIQPEKTAFMLFTSLPTFFTLPPLAL